MAVNNKKAVKISSTTEDFINHYHLYRKKVFAYNTELADLMGYATAASISEIIRRRQNIDPDKYKKFLDRIRTYELSNLNSTRTVDIRSSGTFSKVPFVNLRGRASFAYRLLDDAINESEMREVVNFHPVTGKRYVAFVIEGDSMAPQIKSGSIVLAQECDKSDWQYTTGIVGVFYEDSFVIKRIKDNTLPSGIITLHSDNPSSGSIQIPVKSIHSIWKIIQGIYVPYD